MSEIILEKLHEQRGFYLNLLKHLDFEFMLDPSQNEIKEIEKLKKDTIDQLKKVEQEIAFLLSKE